MCCTAVLRSIVVAAAVLISGSASNCKYRHDLCMSGYGTLSFFLSLLKGGCVECVCLTWLLGPSIVSRLRWDGPLVSYERRSKELNFDNKSISS